jgi:FAD/FMN-containing dehydrogenase
LTDNLEDFNYDYYKNREGQAKLVLQPTSTANVSKILKFCNENMLAVVPQGGNTGLVGGSVPIFD